MKAREAFSAGRRGKPLRRGGAALGAFAALALLAGCDAYFFYPTTEHVENPYVARVGREDVTVTAPDGVRLHGWILSPPEAGPVAGTILFFHGNARNISTHAGGVLWLVHAGYRLVLIDYRGYGQSGGAPSMEGIHQDAAAALDAVFAMGGVDRERIAVLGQSLGGAVAIHAVATSPHKDKIRAVIVDSAFAGYREIARDKVEGVAGVRWMARPLARLVTDRFSPRFWVGRVSPVPILVIHGDADALVPPCHGAELYVLAEEPKTLWIVPGAGHIRAFASEEVRDRLLRYLSEVLGPDGSRERNGPAPPETAGARNSSFSGRSPRQHRSRQRRPARRRKKAMPIDENGFLPENSEK